MTRRAPDVSWERLVDTLATLRAGQENRAVEDALLLAQELHIHQVELEMQNRDLCDVQERIEASHARQVELYDGAAVGYAVLDRSGVILEINLAAASRQAYRRSRGPRVAASFWKSTSPPPRCSTATASS